MRQVFLQKGKIQTKSVSPPLVNSQCVLVRIHYSFISSGTENATISASGTPLIKKLSSNLKSYTSKTLKSAKENGLYGTVALVKGKLSQYMPLGYSSAGEVIGVGSRVERFKVGDYVACAGSSFAHHADVVSVPQNLVGKIRNPSFLKTASLTTIGAIALQGIRRAQLQIGESVCILGLGLIGQISLQLAQHSGCKIIGIDLEEDRLKLAKQFGATLCLNPNSIDVVKEIEFATGHYGVDTTIITAASNSGKVIQQAMQITRRKGKVIIVGDVKLDFDREPFYSKEIDLLMSCSYGPGRYDHQYEIHGNDYPYSYVRWTENRNLSYIINLIQEKKLLVDPLISKEFSINDAYHAYEYLKKNKALGVVLAYTPHSSYNKYSKQKLSFEQSPQVKQKSYVPHSGKLNIALIGAGGFAKGKILPILSRARNLKIHTIIDTNTANGITISRLYNAQRTCNDINKILGDDDIHAVVIATPHVLHTSQALACLSAGKAVLVEKPAAVTFEQFAQLKYFLLTNKNYLFCVDFNRSCSPFMKEIKEVVSTRTNPLFVTYRMNASYLPKNHWIQSEENCGRILGEACHIFELFCFLTDAVPVCVSVSSLNPTTEDVAITDNFSTSITMSDGSCCNLVYSSLGNIGMGKEYMEIFFDGKSIIMDDFRTVKGFGLPARFNKKVKHQEKGHVQLFKQFFKAANLNSEQSPIPVNRILTATEIALVVDKLVRKGGGSQIITG